MASIENRKDELQAMRWISVHDGVTGPKLREFSRMAGCSRAEALGILLNVWLEATKPGNVSITGRMDKFTLRDIEDIFRCEISDGLDVCRISKALVDCGWIDERNGEYFIHDWEDAQGAWIKYQRDRENAARRKREQRERDRLKKTQAPQVLQTSPALPIQEKSDETESDVNPQNDGRKKTNYGKNFEEWWKAYPRHADKGNAYKKYMARRRDGYSEQDLLTAAKAYADECRKNHTEQRFIKHPKTFLSDALPFTEYIPKSFTHSQNADEIERMIAEWRTGFENPIIR